MAAKAKVPAVYFGQPPDPKKMQLFEGVSTSFLPHEALMIYTDKIMAERKAFQTPAGKKWFRDQKRRKQEEDRMTQIFMSHRKAQKERTAECLRRASSQPTLSSSGAAGSGVTHLPPLTK